MLSVGQIEGITFTLCDEPKRKEKYDEYLITHYDKELALENSHTLDGVYKVIGMYKDGQPLNCILIEWKGKQPSPNTYFFRKIHVLQPRTSFATTAWEVVM